MKRIATEEEIMLERMAMLRADEQLTTMLAIEMRMGKTLAETLETARSAITALLIQAPTRSPATIMAREVEDSVSAVLEAYDRHRSVV